METIRRFAGADFDQAVVEPGAVAALVEFDSAAQHYVVLDEVTPSSSEVCGQSWVVSNRFAVRRGVLVPSSIRPFSVPRAKFH